MDYISQTFAGVFGNNGANWGSPVSAPVGRNSSNYAGVGNVGFRVGETSYVLGSDDFGRNNSAGVATSFTVSSGPYEGPYGDAEVILFLI
nr:heterogeneous nuclear ribonucleoprotein 1-like [Ipomoea batatas]